MCNKGGTVDQAVRKSGQLWLAAFWESRLGFLFKFQGKRFESSCVILQGSVLRDLLHSSCSFQQGRE